MAIRFQPAADSLGTIFHPVLQRFAELFGRTPGDLLRIGIQLVVIWVLGWVAGRIVKLIARRIVKAVDDGDDTTMTLAEKRGQTVAQLLRSVGRVVILITVIILSLNLFVDVGPILAGFGILSLAISFGSQSLVKDFISGFFILFENQFAVGDVIKVGDYSGVVERMTMRVVMLRDTYGNLHIIPNGSIVSVSNMTRGWSRAVVEVTVPYAADVDRALAVFRDELTKFREDPAWRTRIEGPAEVTGLETMTENGMMIRSLIRTGPGLQWDVAREFRRRIKARLDTEGIEIAYPQRTVHVRHSAEPGDPQKAIEAGDGAPLP